MSALILDGNAAAKAVLESLKPRIAAANPSLVIVQVGDDPASNSYIKKKLEFCATIGMRAEHKKLPETTTKDDLLALVDALNADKTVTGYIVQLPLPEALWDAMPLVHKAIDPMKDVDGFTARNLGKTVIGKEFEHLPPATPAGIMLLLEHYGIDVAGKHAVVVGRSLVVGKPVALMLLNRDATVTICHSKTKDLASFTKQADILVCAVGQKHLITKDMVKKGVVIVDVGITSTGEGLVGDVDFDEMKEIASAITPMPGGVGPMTVASLLRNCVVAAERASTIK